MKQRNYNILENDKRFLDFVKAGHLDVFKDGKVFNPKTKRYIGSVCAGYTKISCVIDGKIRYIQVHRLIYLFFIGLIPLGYEINHIDTNKQNNNLENLEIVTAKENMAHAKRMGLLVAPKGEINGNAIFTDEEVITIRKLHSENISYYDLAAQYNTNELHIMALVAGHSYNHIPIFKEKYIHPPITSILTHYPKEKIDLIRVLQKDGLSSYKISDQIPDISRATIGRIMKEISTEV